MARFCTHVWRCALRPKTVDTSSTDLRQELNLVDLVPIGLGISIGVGSCISMGTAITEHTGPSIIISILLAALSSLLTGSVCAELGCRMPRNGGIYTHIYTTLGELPALMVSSTLLFDLVVLPALAARGISDYISAINNDTFLVILKKKIPLVENSLIIGEYFDVFALLCVAFAVLLVSLSTKSICQVSTICVGFSLLMLSAVAFITLIQSNLDNWTNPRFFAGGFQGVVSGSAMIGHLTMGWCTTSVISGEVIKYYRFAPILNIAMPLIFLLLLFPLGAGITLKSKSISEVAYLLHLLPGESFFWFRLFVAVGVTICLLCCVMVTIIVASRLLNCLSRDNLAPSYFSKVSITRGAPLVALLCCGLISGIIAATMSTWILSRLTGAGAFAAGISGPLAVLFRRYHPEVFQCLDHFYHSKETPLPDLQMIIAGTPRKKSIFDSANGEDDDDGREEEIEKAISVFWNRGKWISNVIDPQLPPSISTARTTSFLMTTFLTNSIVGSAVARYAGYLGHWWALAVALLCIGGCTVTAVGIWMQPRNVPSAYYYNSPGVPVLPLVAVLVNSLLLFHLPSYALGTGTIVALLAFLSWLILGYRNSIEAILSSALLSRNDSW